MADLVDRTRTACEHVQIAASAHPSWLKRSTRRIAGDDVNGVACEVHARDDGMLAQRFALHKSSCRKSARADRRCIRSGHGVDPDHCLRCASSPTLQVPYGGTTPLVFIAIVVYGGSAHHRTCGKRSSDRS